jgi:hypothetical protein
MFANFSKHVGKNLKMIKTQIYKMANVILILFFNFERKIHSEHNHRFVTNLISNI